MKSEVLNVSSNYGNHEAENSSVEKYCLILANILLFQSVLISD